MTGIHKPTVLSIRTESLWFDFDCYLPGSALCKEWFLIVTEGNDTPILCRWDADLQEFREKRENTEAPWSHSVKCWTVVPSVPTTGEL